MKEGARSRRELKLLMRRSNLPGLLHLAMFVAVLLCTGFLVWFSKGSWWVIPAMFLHGVVWVHLFDLQHECVHYTAFRTRSLDEIFRNICGFAIILPNRFFRYEHCDNHAYTQLHGKDPELIELPVSLGTYLSFVSSVPFWGFRLLEFGRHIICRFSAAEMKFIPREDRVSVVVEARVTAMAYAAILALSAVFDFWAVLWYWLLPLFMVEPVMRAIRMTEHVGRPNVRDMKVNTRTNLVSNPMRFLCWNRTIMPSTTMPHRCRSMRSLNSTGNCRDACTWWNVDTWAPTLTYLRRSLAGNLGSARGRSTRCEQAT